MASASGQHVVEVERRAETGKNACRRLRAAGRVPGNLYGLDRAPFMVSVNPKRVVELLKLGTGVNTVFTLTLKGEESRREAMIKELQRDPVTDALVHIDFMRVDPTRVLHVRVPIRLTGVPIGVRLEGGILDFVQREVEVECLPANIPEHLEVDVTELHLNQHVSVSDLRVAEGVRIMDEASQIIAGVAAPRAEEAPAEAATEAAVAEPQVEKKGSEAAPEKEKA